MAAACSLFFFFLVGVGLLFQDLRDEGRVGLGGNEDGWHFQWG